MLARITYPIVIGMFCLMAVLGGCKDDASQNAEKGTETATEEKKAALVPASELLFDSKEIMGYGGLQSLTALKNMGMEVMKKFQFLPAAAVPSMIDESLKSQMQMTSLEWLDAEKPVVIVVSNPSENEKSGLICVPLKDKALFEKSLPANAVKDQEGNSLKLTGAMGEAIFANFLGESHVVFTEQAPLFAKHKDLIAKDIARVKFENTIELNVNGDGVRNTFKKTLDDARVELEKELDSEESQAELAAAGMDKDQVKKMLAMVDEVRTGLLGVTVVDGHFLLRGEVSATPGSLFAKLLGLSSPVDVGLFGFLPKDAYVQVVSKQSPGGEAAKLLGLPTSFGESQIKGLLELNPDFKLTDAEAAELTKAIKEVEKTSGAYEAAWGMYKSGSFPLSMIGASIVEDGPASYKAQTGLLKLVWKLTAKTMLKDMGGQMPPGVTIDPASFSKTWNSLAPLAAPFGVTLKETVQAGTDGITVDGVNMVVKYEALPMYAQEKEQLDMVKALAGDTLGGALGASKDRVAMGFGPKAAEETRAILASGKGAPTPKLKGFVDRGQKKASAIMYINVIEFLKGLAKLPVPELSSLGVVSNMATGEGAALSFGGDKAATMGFTFDLSLTDAAALVKAFNLSPM